jgi:hypothetical protein
VCDEVVVIFEFGSDEFDTYFPAANALEKYMNNIARNGIAAKLDLQRNCK